MADPVSKPNNTEEKIKLVWTNKETNKKTHTFVRKSIWISIKLIFLYFNEVNHNFDEPPVFDLYSEGSAYYNDVIRIFLSWCGNLDLSFGILQQISELPVYKQYNLAYLLNYLTEETKLQCILPLRPPYDDALILDEIKCLNPGLKQRAYNAYVTIYESKHKEIVSANKWHSGTPEIRLWIFLAISPNVVELFWETFKNNILFVVRLGNRETNKIKNMSFSSTVNYLANFDPIIKKAKLCELFYALPLSSQKITKEMIENLNEREYCEKEIESLTTQLKSYRQLYEVGLRRQIDDYLAEGKEGISKTEKQLKEMKNRYAKANLFQ